MVKGTGKGPRPRNPILDRLERKNSQSKAYRASPKLENKLAKRTGGYRTSGSGNSHEKGDVRLRGITRMEHKGTKHSSFRVTKDMLDKIELASRGCDELPVIVVDFLDERGNSTGQEIACLPMQDLLELLDAASEEPDS